MKNELCHHCQREGQKICPFERRMGDLQRRVNHVDKNDLEALAKLVNNEKEIHAEARKWECTKHNEFTLNIPKISPSC